MPFGFFNYKRYQLYKLLFVANLYICNYTNCNNEKTVVAN